MVTYPLILRSRHLFVEVEGNLWLFDTGAPSSLGKADSITFAGKSFSIGSSFLGLSVDALSDFMGVECGGLLGIDVLGHFDHIIDTISGTLTVSTAELLHIGQHTQLDEFLGIPIVTVQIADSNYRMFLDTGAQLSYLQDDLLTKFPSVGSVSDFYPSIGWFQTEAYEVPAMLGDLIFNLRCGTLPALLATTLMMAGTQGIVGNEILINRSVGYFPRRKLLSL